MCLVTSVVCSFLGVSHEWSVYKCKRAASFSKTMLYNVRYICQLFASPEKTLTFAVQLGNCISDVFSIGNLVIR